MQRATARTLILASLIACLASNGCGLVSYEQGLRWHLENEAMKKELERQGFPQYSPPL